VHQHIEGWARKNRPSYHYMTYKAGVHLTHVLSRGRKLSVGFLLDVSLPGYSDTRREMSKVPDGRLRVTIEEGAEGVLYLVAHEKRSAPQPIIPTEALMLGTSLPPSMYWDVMGVIGQIPTQVSAQVRWYLERECLPTIPFVSYLGDALRIFLFLEGWYPDIYPEAYSKKVPRHFGVTLVKGGRSRLLKYIVHECHTDPVDPQPESHLFEEVGGDFEGTFSF